MEEEVEEKGGTTANKGKQRKQVKQKRDDHATNNINLFVPLSVKTIFEQQQRQFPRRERSCQERAHVGECGSPWPVGKRAPQG